MSTPEKTGENQGIRDEKGRFIEGVSGNPKGKPLGTKNKFSFVKYWQERWEKNPKEFEELATMFLCDEKLRSLIIQMIDGRPTQDVTSGGEKLPTPLLANLNVSNNDSNQEDRETSEKNPSDSGGNISG